MNAPLTEEARNWQARIHEFAERELRPFEVDAELHNGELPREVKQKHRQRAIELGLSRMDVPKAHGGLELSVLTQAVVWEQLGRVTNALGWCFSEPHRWMFDVCTADQIRKYIMPLAEGSKHECYAITEEESGSQVTINTTAEAHADGYRINGEKWYVTSANLAAYFILQAQIKGGADGGEQALFFIDIDSPGVELVANPLFSHTYAAHHPTYRYRDVLVPAANRIGKSRDGMRFTHSWFRRERLMIGARCCGAAARLIEDAIVFVNERRIGEKKLSEHQAIQFMLADSATELAAARLLVYETAAAHDRGEDVKVLHGRCSMAKLYASEMANRVVDRVVQIFGGRGYMRENAAERFFRELRVDRIWEGTSEIQRLIIARSLLKRGLDGV